MPDAPVSPAVSSCNRSSSGKDSHVRAPDGWIAQTSPTCSGCVPGHGPQKHGVDESKDRGRSAGAARECQDCRDRKGGRFAQAARADGEVSHRRQDMLLRGHSERVCHRLGPHVMCSMAATLTRLFLPDRQDLAFVFLPERGRQQSENPSKAPVTVCHRFAALTEDQPLRASLAD